MCEFRRRCAWILGVVPLVAPASALASTVSTIAGTDEEESHYEYLKFTAARGEQNRLTVRSQSTERFYGVIIRDTGSRVWARGRCKSLGPHTARCPASDNVSFISLRDRNDRVTLRRSISGNVQAGKGNDRVALARLAMGTVDGGAGNDRLTGGSFVRFFGGKGDDVLRGGAKIDELRGGWGRDRLYGRGGDDHLVDGETDAHAARDILNGGPTGSYGDSVDFSLRQRRLRIDLGHDLASTRDTIVGIEQVKGGAGDDRLTGSAADNVLEGGPGDDRLDGAAGRDIPMGGPGDDRLSGGPGDDTVWGNAGRDRLDGGGDDDLLESNEPGELGTASPALPDDVACGDGADSVVSDASDSLVPECEQLWAGGARFGTVPTLRGDRAEFSAASLPLAIDVTGTLALHSVAGDQYGKASYGVARDSVTTVSVPLTAAGVAALTDGTVVQVEVIPSVGEPGVTRGGYRMLLAAR